MKCRNNDKFLNVTLLSFMRKFAAKIYYYFFLTHVYALHCLYKISTKKTEANIQSMYVSFCLFEHLWLIIINLTSH